MLAVQNPAFLGAITHPATVRRALTVSLVVGTKARNGHSISLKLVGNPLLRAEGQMLVIGLRLGVPPLWSIKTVTHRLASSGYTTQIEGELPRIETN